MLHGISAKGLSMVRIFRRGGRRQASRMGLLASSAAALLLATVSPLSAQAPGIPANVLAGRQLPPIKPIPKPVAIGEISLLPDLASGGLPEQWEEYLGGAIVRNVTVPTLTPFMPDPAKATGSAVIVAPGGAFRYLGMSGEGDLARKLAERGIMAFVLKYRTVPTPRESNQFLQNLFGLLAGRVKDVQTGTNANAIETPAEAVQDAHAAVRLVRSRAASLKIDPARIGFVGFSAGATLAVRAGITPDESARPDFIGSFYGPTEVGDVPAYASPLFSASSVDDPLFSPASGGLLAAWAKAKRPVEAHYYERGGHGFGKGTTGDKWFDEFVWWLQMRGYLKAAE
jgi:dienelactone hydrolase